MENQQEEVSHLEDLKTIWMPDRFISEVENAALKHSPPYNRFPQIIELSGTIAEMADQIWRETESDPEKRERSTYGKIDLNDKLVLKKEIEIGEGDTVTTNTELLHYWRHIDSKYEKKESLALIIHSHGILDTPASFKDLTTLLVDATQAEIVLTASTKMLFLRSLETPVFDQKEVDEMLADKKSQFASELIGLLRERGEHQNKGVQASRNMQAILDICRNFKIAVYNSLNGHRYSKINNS